MTDYHDPRWIGHRNPVDDPEPPLDFLLAWIDRGFAAYHSPVDAHLLPPIADRRIQRAWLAGYGAAWCEAALTAPFERPDSTVVAALSRALVDHPALLRELLVISTPIDRWRLH
jgi:hypothetical protein